MSRLLKEAGSWCYHCIGSWRDRRILLINASWETLERALSLWHHFSLMSGAMYRLSNDSLDAIGSSPHRSSRLPSPETSINPILPSVVSKTRASTPYPRRRPSFITTSPTFSLARKSKVNCFPNYSHEKVERSKRMNKPLNSPKDSNLSENIQLSTTLPIIVSENNKIKEVHASSNSPPSSKHSSTFPTTQHAQTTNW